MMKSHLIVFVLSVAMLANADNPPVLEEVSQPNMIAIPAGMIGVDVVQGGTKISEPNDVSKPVRIIGRLSRPLGTVVRFTGSIVADAPMERRAQGGEVVLKIREIEGRPIEPPIHMYAVGSFELRPNEFELNRQFDGLLMEIGGYKYYPLQALEAIHGGLYSQQGGRFGFYTQVVILKTDVPTPELNRAPRKQD